MNIVVVGCGQLGSRHLQSLANYLTPINVFAIDPFQASLDVAKARWEEIEGSKNHSITFSTDYSQLPQEVFFAVIATNASVRFSALSTLSESSKVSNVLLEKFLFNSVKEYDKCSELLIKKEIKCWVNCTRRMLPSYVSLKSQLKDIKTINYFGNSWNMASNAIHFIDIAEYLFEDHFIEIKLNLTTGMLESKRKGYYEFYGEMELISNSGNLKLTCNQAETISVNGLIETKNKLYAIAEGKEMRISNSEDTTVVEPFPIEYQSSLTEKVLFDLVQTGECELVSYEDSKRQHLLVLNGLANYFEKKNQKLCPIT